MATEIRRGADGKAEKVAWSPYRLTVRQFLAIVEAEVFPRETRVELLGGVLVRMMVKGDPHDNTLDALGEALRRLTPEG